MLHCPSLTVRWKKIVWLSRNLCFSAGKYLCWILWDVGQVVLLEVLCGLCYVCLFCEKLSFCCVRISNVLKIVSINMESRNLILELNFAVIGLLPLAHIFVYCYWMFMNHRLKECKWDVGKDKKLNRLHKL